MRLNCAMSCGDTPYDNVSDAVSLTEPESCRSRPVISRSVRAIVYVGGTRPARRICREVATAERLRIGLGAETSLQRVEARTRLVDLESIRGARGLTAHLPRRLVVRANTRQTTGLDGLLASWDRCARILGRQMLSSKSNGGGSQLDCAQHSRPGSRGMTRPPLRLTELTQNSP